jgi:hypothetical protein
MTCFSLQHLAGQDVRFSWRQYEEVDPSSLFDRSVGAGRRRIVSNDA